MNVVNCSTRLPPAPLLVDGVEPYQVIVKPANGHHEARATGIGWDGKQWVYWNCADDVDGHPFEDGVVVAWVDPLPEVIIGGLPTSGVIPAREEEDPLNLTVTLTGADATKRIGVIKLIRELLGLGLGDAKAFVESAPKVVKDGLSRPDAEALKERLIAAGGLVKVEAV